MIVNPGGRLNPRDIYGREQEIRRYWQVLQRHGLILSTERRIGKTHIAFKMLEESPSEYLPIYQDLEGVHTITELVGSIYQIARPSLKRTKLFKSRLVQGLSILPDQIGGVELPNITRTWQNLLSSVAIDLIKAAEGKTVLLFWDEFALMIYNISQSQGEHAAIDLLDQLRSIRQQHSDKLKFFLTGSIGLHLVLRSLRQRGNGNEPVNDMYRETVPPMRRRQSLKLINLLLDELSVESDHHQIVAQLIYDQVGGFPYYIHHVVDQLAQLERSIIKSDVSVAVDNLLYDSQDPAEYGYYLSRLSTYYEPSDRDIALIVLDSIAKHTRPIEFEIISKLCRERDSSLSDEQIRAVLQHLHADHYLEAKNSTEGLTYEFRWKLVKRWWKAHRL